MRKTDTPGNADRRRQTSVPLRAVRARAELNRSECRLPVDACPGGAPLWWSACSCFRRTVDETNCQEADRHHRRLMAESVSCPERQEADVQRSPAPCRAVAEGKARPGYRRGASWLALKPMGNHHGTRFPRRAPRAMEPSQDRRSEGSIQAQEHRGTPCSTQRRPARPCGSNLPSRNATAIPLPKVRIAAGPHAGHLRRRQAVAYRARGCPGAWPRQREQHAPADGRRHQPPVATPVPMRQQALI